MLTLEHGKTTFYMSPFAAVAKEHAFSYIGYYVAIGATLAWL